MSDANPRDFGLTYAQALRAIARRIYFAKEEEELDPNEVQRVKDMIRKEFMREADVTSLSRLLIKKGVFTRAELIEELRLGANETVAQLRGDVEGNSP